MKLALLGGAAVCAVSALGNSLKLTKYTVKTDKVKEKIRLALVTDMHCKDISNPQNELSRLICQSSPDAVLFGGDIIEAEVTQNTNIPFLRSISALFPCFYVSGNHEFRRGYLRNIKQILSGYGITVLSGENKKLCVNDDEIFICGIDDADALKGKLSSQLDSADTDGSSFSVLLSHRPEYIVQYAKGNFDLVLSGHTHGGQWCIPHIVNGVYAPGQGFFPKYSAGLYTVFGKKLIISRGISISSTGMPRIFNSPELVIIDICPAEE